MYTKAARANYSDPIRCGERLVFLWYELRNALVVNMRRGQIERTGVREYLSRFAGLRLQLHNPAGGEGVVELAARQGLSDDADLGVL